MALSITALDIECCCLVSFMLSVINSERHLCWASFMLSVIYAECSKQVLYAEFHYAECRYAECRGPTNIRLGRKDLSGTNALAYLSPPSVTTKKRSKRRRQIVREKRSRFSFSSNVDVDIDGVAKPSSTNVGEKDLLLLFESLPSHDDSNLDTRL